MQNDFELIRSDRKTVAIQIMPDLHIRVRAPRQMPIGKIRLFLAQKEQWIISVSRRIQNSSSDIATEKLAPEAIQSLKYKAMEYLPVKVEYYAKKMDVTFEKISVRCQTTRWGSCSSKGNLSFNCLLMLTPEYVREYIIVHELCHRKHMNHSPAFWTDVEYLFPNYRQAKAWLKENGYALIGKIK